MEKVVHVEWLWAGRGSGIVSPRRANRHMKPLLTIEETAVLLGIGRTTLYRAVGEGRVPFPVHQIGGIRYVPRSAVDRLLEGGGSSRSDSNFSRTRDAGESPWCA
jgi:excisionase family DNA binding protein